MSQLSLPRRAWFQVAFPVCFHSSEFSGTVLSWQERLCNKEPVGSATSCQGRRSLNWLPKKKWDGDEIRYGWNNSGFGSCAAFVIVKVGVGCKCWTMFCASVEIPEALGLFLVPVSTWNWKPWIWNSSMKWMLYCRVFTLECSPGRGPNLLG